MQYCKKYSAHMFNSPLSLMNTRHNKRTREEAKSGRWSTTSNDCPLDLFDGLDSGTALFLCENFRIMFCAMLYQKSSEVIEGVDAILL